MLIKPDSSHSASTAVATTCGNCGTEERRLLHHVRHRGIFRRLCTTCVLRLHSQYFCPSCFQVYPSLPPNEPIVTCIKCYSTSHSHCVSSPTPSPYICPLCANPNFPLFRLKTVKEANISVGEANEGNANSENLRVIDKSAAKVLLAAAKIASVSMNKAAATARSEAERRAKEAAFTRKRAREALEQVAYLAAKEKLRKKEALLSSAEVQPPVGITNMGQISGGVQLKRENASIRVDGIANRSGSVGAGAGGAMVGLNGNNFHVTANVDRVDSSVEVLAALNAVELRETAKIGKLHSQGVALVPPNGNAVMMDVENNGGVKPNGGLRSAGAVAVKDNADRNELVNTEDHNMQGEKTEQGNSGVELVSPIEGQMQDEEKN